MTAPEAVEATVSPRARRGRFSSDLGYHEALDLAAEIARAAANPGEDPWRIGVKRFDEKRRELGGIGLSARRLRARFRTEKRHTFSDVLKLALTDPGKRGSASREAGVRAVPGDMPRDLMWQCVRAAAYQLKRTPTAVAFDAWATERFEQREREGAPPHHIPCSTTLIERAGSWEKVLVAADLDPADIAAQARARGTAPYVLDVLDDFLAEHGCLPPAAYFEKWCELTDRPYSRRDPGDRSRTRRRRTWGEIREDLRERRAASGLWTPTEVTSGSLLPPLPDQAPSGLRRRRARKRTEEEALESLRIYAREFLTDGRRPTQKHYLACATGDDRMVTASVLQNFGTFQGLCRKAGI